MTAHTPGPWEIKDGFLKEHGPTGMYLARFEESSGLGYAGKANAALIAAAPDMLAALRTIAQIASEGRESDIDIESIARDAIAKAEDKS